MRGVDHEFPLGKRGTSVAFIGSAGIDAFGINGHAIDWIPDGRKHPYKTRQALDDLVVTYAVGITPQDEHAGQTGANVASGEGKISTGDVLLYAPIAPNDPSTPRIRSRLQVAGVTLIETPAPDTHNPYSVVLPPHENRRIAAFKDDKTPPINVYQVGMRPAFLGLCSAPGDWSKSWINGIDFANANGLPKIPTVIFASESQIKQLAEDPEKKKVYMDALGESVGFFGNLEEAEMVVEASGQIPRKRQPRYLAHQITNIGPQEKAIISISNGDQGAILLDRYLNFHTLEVPKLPVQKPGTHIPREQLVDGLGPIVNNIGAGDQYGIIIGEGIRTWGTTPEGIGRSMQKAGEGAARVLSFRDAQTGQLTTEQFLAPPHPAFHHDMKTAISWVFPEPAVARRTI